MQLQIINGIYTDNGPDVRVSYPVNLVPCAQSSGVSQGYLRPAEGIISFTQTPGIARGMIVYNGNLFGVFGSKLCSITNQGIVTIIGDVGNDNLPVTLEYSFDNLAICSNGNLFYYNTTTGLNQVTDPDLGVSKSIVWIDGYFASTDGENIIVTELNDPTQVNPLKYGSSELDPDPIVAITKIRNELVAINRFTIEFFDNIGGDRFPFSRIKGAQITRGAIGHHAWTVMDDSIAFLGSGHNESVAIYVGQNAQTTKISTPEIDFLLKQYSDDELSRVVVETRNNINHTSLYIHLPDRTLVFDTDVSKTFQQPVWHVLTSTSQDYSKYRANFFTWCYDKWFVSDTVNAQIGYMNEQIGEHFDTIVRWEFGTTMTYNEGRGAIFHSLELVSLTGRVNINTNPIISTSYSTDGLTWSQLRDIYAGQIGNRNKRLVWLRNGIMRNWRIQKFSGTSDAHLSFIRLEAQLEPLS